MQPIEIHTHIDGRPLPCLLTLVMSTVAMNKEINCEHVAPGIDCCSCELTKLKKLQGVNQLDFQSQMAVFVTLFRKI